MKGILLAILIFFIPGTTNSFSQVEYTDFNSGLNGWVPVNGSSVNKWEWGGTAGYNITQGAYISNDGGITNNYSIDKSSVVHMYKDIDFSLSASKAILSFRWRSNGEEDFDYLSTHIVPTSVMPVAGEELNQGLLMGREMSDVDYFRGKAFVLDAGIITEPTMRVVFSWRNNESGGMQPAAAIDNIEITNLETDFGTWDQRISMPSGTYYSSSLRNSFGLITIGGFNSTNIPQNKAYEYNMIGNRWAQLPDLLDAYTHSAAAKFDGYIYNIAGFKNGGSSPTNEVNRLSLSDFSWNDFEPLPVNLFYSRAIALRKAMYVIGGSDENSNLLNDVYYLEKGGSTWLNATPLPGDGRADGGLVQLDKYRIMYVGGYTNATDHMVQVDSIFIGTINPDDPGDISWKPGTNFPGGHRARIHAYSWGDGKAIVVGGSAGDDFTPLSDAWVYDADIDSWSSWTQLPNKPTPITAYQGASYNIADNIWMLFITGGVTTGPAITSLTEVYTDTVETPVSVELINNNIPSDYYLSQNYPNPFNPVTNIHYKIPSHSHTLNVTLKVYDILGNEIAVLVNDDQAAGEYRVSFNAEALSSGVYFYRLNAGNFADTKKIILMK